MAHDMFCNYGYDTPAFTLKYTKCYARCVGVSDGDTCQLIIPFAGQMYKFSIRLQGIDTSEMTSKDPQNKARAIRARNRLIELVTGGTSPCPEWVQTKKQVQSLLNEKVYLVWVECLEMDKYGRVLANLYHKEPHTDDIQTSFSDILLQENLAYMYGGKTKLTPEEQNARF